MSHTLGKRGRRDDEMLMDTNASIRQVATNISDRHPDFAIYMIHAIDLMYSSDITHRDENTHNTIMALLDYCTECLSVIDEPDAEQAILHMKECYSQMFQRQRR
jgi:hypothetical protein